MRFSKIIKLFERYSVCVTGAKGAGKDLLVSNVISRRKQPYVCNIDYGGDFHQLDFDAIDCGKNTWRDFLNGTVTRYIYPYPMGADIYLSDAGVYLPSQYCNEINKAFPYIATFMALSRQVGKDAKFHCNVQNLNRVYDKTREHFDFFITANRSFVLFGGRLVIQKITLYDKYDSCLNRVRPCRVRRPWRNKEAQLQADIYRDNFYNQHGTVKRKILVYRNKSSYDTYHFGNLLSSAPERNM